MSEPGDHTKYRFDGELLGKGRLVLALIKRWVADHPEATFAQLREAFPDSLQADSPVQFSRLQVAVARLAQIPEQEVRRFFVGPGEIMRLADGDVAVSREWNRVNIQNVVAQAGMLGYAVNTVPSADRVGRG